jgi:hypothetical protein
LPAQHARPAFSVATAAWAIGGSSMTTETPEEFRQRLLKADNQFYEDTNKRTEPYRNRAFEYEKLGVEYTHRGFQALTYLNGGALVAIPTAMAFFKADVGKVDVLWTASAFILGLLCVVLAQLAAFFVMLKRVEENTFLSHEQFEQLAALQFPHGSPDNLKHANNAATNRATALERNRYSDIWRNIGLCLLCLSLVAFVAGCGWGARAVITAKEAVTRP